MNHRTLLNNYILHIASREGGDMLNDYDLQNSKLSAEEVNELKKISPFRAKNPDDPSPEFYSFGDVVWWVDPDGTPNEADFLFIGMDAGQYVLKNIDTGTYLAKQNIISKP